MTKAWKIGCGIACIPLVCCLGGFGVIQVTINRAGGGLETELARVKAAGLPTELADLKRNIPSSQNAAPIYSEIHEKLEKDRALSKLVTEAGVQWENATAEQKKANAAAYPKVGNVIALYEKAADLPHSEFNRPWETEGFMTLFPEFARMKGGAKLLAGKALRQSDAGEWQGAMLSIRRGAQIGRHAAEDRILIGLLVEIACEAIVIRALDDVIEQHARNPKALDQADATLKGFGPLPDFRAALEGEMVFGRSGIHALKGKSFAQMNGSDAANPESSMLDGLLNNEGIRRAFEKEYIKAFTDYLISVPDDPTKWREAYNASKEVDKKMSNDKSFWNMLNRIIFPVYSQASLAVGVAETRRKLTALEIALFRTRNSTGAFPKDLKSYGALAIDPISGKNFVYKPSPKGFLIYGVGQDEVDDGGAARNTNGKYDIVIDTR